MTIHVRIIITDYIFILQYDVKIQPPQPGHFLHFDTERDCQQTWPPSDENVIRHGVKTNIVAMCGPNICCGLYGVKS